MPEDNIISTPPPECPPHAAYIQPSLSKAVEECFGQWSCLADRPDLCTLGEVEQCHSDSKVRLTLLPLISVLPCCEC